MLEFRDVPFSYGDEATPSLENVSLEIRKGETVVLCGESEAQPVLNTGSLYQ